MVMFEHKDFPLNLMKGFGRAPAGEWRDPTVAPQAGLDVNYSDWTLIAVFGR